MSFSLRRDGTEHQKLMVDKAMAGTVTTADLVQGLYADANWDGLRGAEVWHRMHQIESHYSSLSFWKKFYFGMGALSIYNCARMGSLTASGKKLALIGTGLSVYMLACCHGRQRHLARLASETAPAEEAKE